MYSMRTPQVLYNAWVTMYTCHLTLHQQQRIELITIGKRRETKVQSFLLQSKALWKNKTKQKVDVWKE